MIMNLKLGMPQDTKVYANIYGWWGTPAHTFPGINYVSTNPWTVRRQLDLMQEVGVAGVVYVWYGVNAGPLHQAAQEFAFQCEQRKMLFIIQIDGGLFNWFTTRNSDGSRKYPSDTDEMLHQLEAGRDLFTCAAYSPEKGILDFNAFKNVDRTKWPLDYLYLREHSEYTWVETAETMRDYLTRCYATGTVKLGSLVYQFEDGAWDDRAHSVWTRGNPARHTWPGVGTAWHESVEALWTDAAPKHVQIVTWNDYEEGTAIEGMASAFTGLKVY